MAEYSHAFILTKKGNLLPWWHSQDFCSMSATAAEYYGRERDIELIAMFRYEPDRETKCGHHTLCKIKCPVNPLPIKGEFEAPSREAVLHFLKANGWCLKQKLDLTMFE